MGLYDKVVSFFQIKHPGLLKLAENELENNPSVIFNNAARKLNIKKACILVCNDDYYRLFLSTGFSTDVLSESVSTSDFWDGTLPHSEWANLSHEEANPFLQLFSKDDVSSIARLHIKRFTASDIKYIFMSAEDDQEPAIPDSDLEFLVSSFSSFITEKNG